MPPFAERLARLTGVARRFERDGDGWRCRDGARTIRITAAERDVRIAEAARATGWHLAALALCALAAGLLAERLFAGAAPRAIGFAVLTSLAAMALHLSWEGVTRATRAAPGPGYNAIAGGVIALLFVAALATEQPPSATVALGAFAVMGGVYLAAHRWRADRRLSPVQRAQARDQRRADRSALTAGLVVAVIAFFLAEAVAMAVAFALAVGGVASLAGVAIGDASGWLLAAGIAAGIGAALLAVWPIDRLCVRWTGESAFAAFSSLPPGW